jgi:hypothetical protein
MLLPGSPAVLAVMLAAYFIAGVSFGRDERRAEQVLGDDDPITLPTSVVPWIWLPDPCPLHSPNGAVCRSCGFLIVHRRISFGQNAKAGRRDHKSIEQT